MKFYKDSKSYDWTGHVNATEENVKVGDGVKVIHFGYPRLRVSDGVVVKMTKTTIHVKHESAYPENGKWHVFESTSIFRKHTRYASTLGVSYEDTFGTTIYKVV